MLREDTYINVIKLYQPSLLTDYALCTKPDLSFIRSVLGDLL